MKGTKVVSKRLFLFLSVGTMVLFQGCSGPSVLDSESYIRYMEKAKSGMLVTKEIGDLDFMILFQTTDYLLSKEVTSGHLKNQDIEKRKKELQGIRHFVLRIKNKKGTDPVKAISTSEAQYDQTQQYLSSEITRDFALVDGKDTLPCQVCHYERSYCLSPYVTLVLGFPEHETGKTGARDLKFLYRDRVFGMSNIWMSISGSDIQSLPTVRFN